MELKFFKRFLVALPSAINGLPNVHVFINVFEFLTKLFAKL